MKGVGALLGITFIVWVVIFIWPVNERPRRAFLSENELDEGPLVIAHGGGGHLAPSNTMAAFENAYEMGVDVLEYDVHMTADGHLVTIHDDTVDRTTNGSGRVNDLTLEEVQSLDAGYHFEDTEGEHSFRGRGVSIPTVEELFTHFPDVKHLIELKDTNDESLWENMVQEMWRLIEDNAMHDRVMVASFTHAINERFQEVSNDTVAIGGGEEEVRPFAYSHILFLNSLSNPNADAFQLPTEQEGHDLTRRNILRGAHNRGMHVYYWTINEKDRMQDLIDKGASGIITDRPDYLLDVLNR